MRQGSLSHRETTRKTLQGKYPTKVEKSRNYPVYDRWVKSGWPDTFCERKAKEVFNESISHDSFRNYHKKLDPKDVIPTDIMREKLNQVDVIIDEVSEIDVMILNQELRVGRALKKEEGMPLPMKIVDDMMKTLKDLIETRAMLTSKLKGPTTSVAVHQTAVVPDVVMRGDEVSGEELNERIRRILDGRSPYESEEE